MSIGTHGHGPTKIYDVGHFDFHFYLISEKEREAITAKGDDLARNYKPLSPEYTPAGYVLAPDSAVPRMGAHWADLSSHEFHGRGFTKTFLFGSYDGRVIFLEPMITHPRPEFPAQTRKMHFPHALSASVYERAENALVSVKRRDPPRLIFGS